MTSYPNSQVNDSEQIKGIKHRKCQYCVIFYRSEPFKKIHAPMMGAKLKGNLVRKCLHFDRLSGPSLPDAEFIEASWN
jgi:hypothetical protein